MAIDRNPKWRKTQGGPIRKGAIKKLRRKIQLGDAFPTGRSFLATNRLGAYDTFNYRAKYTGHAYDNYHGNKEALRFFKSEVQFYGLIDESGYAIIPLKKSLSAELAPIFSVADPNFVPTGRGRYGTNKKESSLTIQEKIVGYMSQYMQRQRALHPIMNSKSQDAPVLANEIARKAFDDFVGAYNIKIKELEMENDINSKFLKDLKAHKGYEDPLKAYKTYNQNLYSQFDIFLTKGRLMKKIVDFDTFVPIMTEYIERLGSKYPITFNGYITSKWNTPLSSGLMIEVADLKYSEDQKKINEFIDDPAFQIYADLALRHGFIIDRHIPWRLVCNLGSQQFINYSVQDPYYINTTAEFFVNYYRKACWQSTRDLVQTFISFYTSFVVKYPGFNDYVWCEGIMHQKYITRKTTNRSEIMQAYPDAFWLRKLLEVRNIETNKKIDEQKIENIWTEVMSLNEWPSTAWPLESLEEYIEKFFMIRPGVQDNQDSLRWWMKKMEQKLENNLTTANNNGNIGSSGTGGY